MNYEGFKKFVEEVGAENILILFFDNNRTVYYPKGNFNPDDITEYNGELVVKEHTFIHSSGANGGFNDIPVTVYNTQLQSVVVLDNATKDRKRIDIHEMYMM